MYIYIYIYFSRFSVRQPPAPEWYPPTPHPPCFKSAIVTGIQHLGVAILVTVVVFDASAPLGCVAALVQGFSYRPLVWAPSLDRNTYKCHTTYQIGAHPPESNTGPEQGPIGNCRIVGECLSRSTMTEDSLQRVQDSILETIHGAPNSLT